MANRRSQNFLNQQRVDVPHLKSIESAVRNDFDELLNAYAIGEDASYVLRGFEISMSGAVGSAANGLQLIVDDASIFHGASDEAGTFFAVPSSTPNETLNATTNDKVDGSFTPSTSNYVGLEFTRSIDNTTAAQVFLWNPTAKTEITKTLPLAITLDYKVVITSSIWASNVLPLAIVETDGSNNVIEVTDRRPLLFRLGTAGASSPDPFHLYPWNNQTEGRVENPSSSTSITSPFRGGDKMILHMKEWMDAVMSSIQEIKGTAYWYTQNTPGSLSALRFDVANTQMTGSGKFTHNSITAGQVNWDSDIFLNIISSRLKYKIDVNAASTDITLSDNQVAYLKFIRNINISPNLIFTNGSAIVSSVGAVSWTTGLQAGDFIKVAEEDDTKYYEILSVDSTSQVTLTQTFLETSTGSLGKKAKYSFGTYQTNAAPSTDRHIKIANKEDVPFDQDTYWLFLRSDDGAVIPKIFIRGYSGGELEQGESREISDNTTEGIVQYIGSPSEGDGTPEYTTALGPSTPNSIVIDGENLTAGIKRLDNALGGLPQNNNLKLIKGGAFSWVLASTTLTWTQDAYIQIPGLTDVRNTILAGNTTLIADGEVAYVTINRTAGGATNLTVNTGLISGLTLGQDDFIIARRVGSDVIVGTHSFLLKDGEILEIDGALAEINRYFDNSKIIKHESSVSKVRINEIDQSTLEGDSISQEIDGEFIDFSGAVINFTTGVILKEDDATPLGDDFTPQAIPVGEYFWYGISLVPDTTGADNRVIGKLQIDFASASNAVEASAPFASMEGNQKLGGVLVQNVAGVITVQKIKRVIAGSGGGSSLLAVQDKIEGVTGVTITFANEVYTFGSANNKFYRNGILMCLVSSFSSFTPGDPESYAHEYMEVDGGSSSTMITLHSDFPAVVEDLFQMCTIAEVNGVVSGGAGTIMKKLRDSLSGVSGSPITFLNEVYVFGSADNAFYRNGNLMVKVVSFSGAPVGPESFAHEYQEVDNGANSNQIILHPNFLANATDDRFDMCTLIATFNGNDLAQKTLLSARGFGDATNLKNCTIAPVGGKTRVTLLSPFKYVYDLNSGNSRGDLNVEINGQEIERLIPGTNDVEGNIVYEEEVNGAFVDVYKIVAATPTVLSNETNIQIWKVQYRVADLSESQNIIPAVNCTYDLGTAGLRWKDIYLCSSTIHIGDDAVDEGQFRWEPGTKKLQFRHLAADAFQDLGTVAADVWTLMGLDFVVGNAGDVTAGLATHSTIASAIAAAVDGNKIRLLKRTFTENLTITKRLNIEGLGNDSVIDGTVQYSAGANKGSVHALKFNDDVTVDSGVTDLIITNNWIANSKVITDNNPGVIDKNLYSFNKSEE